MANINARLERMEAVAIEQCTAVWERMIDALFDVRSWIENHGTPEQLTVFDAWAKSEILTTEQQAIFAMIDTPHDARLLAAIAAMDRFPTVVIDKVLERRRALAKDKVEPGPEAEMINDVT